MSLLVFLLLLMDHIMILAFEAVGIVERWMQSLDMLAHIVLCGSDL